MKVMAVNAKKWLVTAYGSVDLDPTKVQASLDGDDTYLETSLKSMLTKNLVGSLPSDHVVLSVPTGRTYTRAFSVPISAEKHLKDAVELEIDQYIPLPADTLYVDYEVIERTKDQLTVSMSAVPRVLVDRYISIIENTGLRVCMVEPGISAVARVLEATEEGHLPTVIIDIGPASTDIAILDGSIRVTGSTGVGGNTFTLDISNKLKVPLNNAHQLKVLSGLSLGPRQEKITKALSPSLDRITTEVRKVMRFYAERLGESDKIDQVLIIGAGSNMPGIGEYYTNELVMPVRVASPWQKLDFGHLPQPNKQFRPRYITVAGLGSAPTREILQ